ncbi:nucleotidyltransferase domain-containing protein [Candidatus Woesearchaeota archaeon]|nr:nucleotidyltransferase domain-containing protein [Candidatus Woesearchaeota archaeon]
MGRKKHIEYLKEFKRNLTKRVPIDKMLLFGSRAYGKPHRWSDFDLIIVSKKFRNLDSLKRSLGFYDYWNLNYPVDFLCYTPEEFNKLKKQITIVREAIKEGIEI